METVEKKEVDYNDIHSILNLIIKEFSTVAPTKKPLTIPCLWVGLRAFVLSCT
jgi:hypothetical protein